MIFRRPPFEDTQPNHTDYNLIRNQRYDEFWDRIEKKGLRASMSLKRLFLQLFAADPTQRPSLTQLEQDEWLLGPTKSQEEMKKFFDPRYEKLSDKHPETVNIRRALIQKLEEKMK
jgi:serine/threonine protein kinase